MKKETHVIGRNFSYVVSNYICRKAFSTHFSLCFCSFNEHSLLVDDIYQLTTLICADFQKDVIEFIGTKCTPNESGYCRFLDFNNTFSFVFPYFNWVKAIWEKLNISKKSYDASADVKDPSSTFSLGSYLDAVASLSSLSKELLDLQSSNNISDKISDGSLDTVPVLTSVHSVLSSYGEKLQKSKNIDAFPIFIPSLQYSLKSLLKKQTQKSGSSSKQSESSSSAPPSSKKKISSSSSSSSQHSSSPSLVSQDSQLTPEQEQFPLPFCQFISICLTTVHKYDESEK